MNYQDDEIINFLLDIEIDTSAPEDANLDNQYFDHDSKFIKACDAAFSAMVDRCRSAFWSLCEDHGPEFSEMFDYLDWPKLAYLTFMSIEGHGVGLWDGDYSEIAKTLDMSDMEFSDAMVSLCNDQTYDDFKTALCEYAYESWKNEVTQ